MLSFFHLVCPCAATILSRTATTSLTIYDDGLPFSKLILGKVKFFQCARSCICTVIIKYVTGIPHICHFFTQAKFLENKIYTKKTRKLLQNTQKIANFLHYYGKIHSKLPIFRVKSVKIYAGQFFLHRHRLWCL